MIRLVKNEDGRGYQLHTDKDVYCSRCKKKLDKKFYVCLEDKEFYCRDCVLKGDCNYLKLHPQDQTHVHQLITDIIGEK